MSNRLPGDNVSLGNHGDNLHSKILLLRALCKLAIRLLGAIYLTEVIFTWFAS